jgi:uncharacterized protein (TIRG00374 family)
MPASLGAFLRRRVLTRPQLTRLFWLTLAIGLFWLTLRAVPLEDVWLRLRSLTPGQVLLLVLVNVVVLVTFSLRWWLLLAAQGYVLPYLSLMGYRLATFAVSYFTPGPHFGGEPLQVYLVTARHGVPVSASLAAVVIDKILEMLANFAFLSAGILVALRQQAWIGLDEMQLVGASLLLLSAPLALLVALALGWRPLTWLVRWAGRTWGWFGRAAGRPARDLTQTRFYATLAESETQSITLCRNHPRTMILAVAVSGLSWVAMIGEFWLMTNVLGLGLTLPQAITAMAAARLAILLPLPAGLGALEASQVLAMRGLGLPAAAGVSLSLLIRARDVLLGLLGLGLAGLLLGRWAVGRTAESGETADAAIERR